MTATAIIVFAKAPVAGQAKTRLIPALGAEGAARLAERLLRHTVQQALAAGVGPVLLCVTPDATHPVFAELAVAHQLPVFAQSDGDLGLRMTQAFAEVMDAKAAALLIGTDAPALDAAALQQASAALRGHDAVFVPTVDGGYVLVGLKHPAPQLFTDMRWSHDQVMAHTRQRLAASGMSHLELPTLHDIDEAADLVHLPTGWPERCCA